MSEIEILKAENKRLWDALECIAKHCKDSVTPVDWRNIVLIIGDIASAALDKKSKKMIKSVQCLHCKHCEVCKKPEKNYAMHQCKDFSPAALGKE
jgi:hypothetical protein